MKIPFMRLLRLVGVVLGVWLAVSPAYAFAPTKPNKESPPPQVRIRGSVDRVLELLLYGRNETQPDREGRRIIEMVAQTLKQHPEVKLVEVVGNANDSTSEAKNLRISEARAKVVEQMLIQLGVEPQRLRTRAMGSKKPYAYNHSAEQQRRNRRIDFDIITLDDGNPHPIP